MDSSAACTEGEAAVSAVAPQQLGDGFDSQARGLFCLEFAFSLWVRVGSLRVLEVPTTVQKHASEVNWKL